MTIEGSSKRAPQRALIRLMMAGGLAHALGLLAKRLALTKRKRRRRIFADDAFKVGFTSLGGTLEPGLLALLPGVPFGAGAAHVVTLGPIGIARHPKQTLPTPDQDSKAVAKRK